MTSAQTLIGVGVLIALVLLFADPLRLGRYPGFGWLQEVGVIVGCLAILAGFYLRGRRCRWAPCTQTLLWRAGQMIK